MKCFRCGDCCKSPYYGMTLTHEELDLLPIKLHTKNTHNKNRLVAVGEVCPFYKEGKCSVYEVRPCQCRLYHCGRLKEGDKKLETMSEIWVLMQENPEYSKFRKKMDAEATEWGNRHGWNWRKIGGD